LGLRAAAAAPRSQQQQPIIEQPSSQQQLKDLKAEIKAVEAKIRAEKPGPSSEFADDISHVSDSGDEGN
jgi:alkylation response protein AidB-like acyl-CoA dehydrogenase